MGERVRYICDACEEVINKTDIYCKGCGGRIMCTDSARDGGFTEEVLKSIMIKVGKGLQGVKKEGELRVSVMKRTRPSVEVLYSNKGIKSSVVIQAHDKKAGVLQASMLVLVDLRPPFSWAGLTESFVGGVDDVTERAIQVMKKIITYVDSGEAKIL